MNEHLITSGSVNFNICRMVEDHVPLRIDEIERQIDEIEREIESRNLRIDKLIEERDALMRTMDGWVD